MQAPTHVQDVILPMPLPTAYAFVSKHVKDRNERGRWESREERIQTCVLLCVMNSRNDHRRIAKLLHRSEPEVLEAINQLFQLHLITMESIMPENALNVQLLNDSFAAIKANGEQFASAFYQRLFTKYPMTRPIFVHTFARTDKGASEAQTVQKEALLGALAFVVLGVFNHKDITAELKELGKRHKQYGVLPIHYSMAGECLMETFEWYFLTFPTPFPAFTPELRKTWGQAYEMASTAMMSG